MSNIAKSVTSIRLPLPSGHDGQNVRLYLEESFSFRAVTPEAAVVLTA